MISSIYSLSCNLGKKIVGCVGREQKDFVFVLKDSYLLYTYLSDTTSKTIKLPWKLMQMSSFMVIAFNVGMMDSILNTQNRGFTEEELTNATKNSIFQIAKDASRSVLNALQSSYKSQKAKLEKLDKSITDSSSIGSILKDKHWNKPSELVSRKIMAEDSFMSNTIKPIADFMKIGVNIVIGTTLSSSFKAGKWIGETYF